VGAAVDEENLREYSPDRDAAKKLVSTGIARAPDDLDASALAAWTSVSRVIINLSETITRS
jgi:hypothetical protein